MRVSFITKQKTKTFRPHVSSFPHPDLVLSLSFAPFFSPTKARGGGRSAASAIPRPAPLGADLPPSPLNIIQQQPSHPIFLGLGAHLPEGLLGMSVFLGVRVARKKKSNARESRGVEEEKQGNAAGAEQTASTRGARAARDLKEEPWWTRLAWTFTRCSAFRARARTSRSGEPTVT